MSAGKKNACGSREYFTRLPFTNGFGYFCDRLKFRQFELCSAMPSQKHDSPSWPPIYDDLILRVLDAEMACVQGRRAETLMTQ